MSLSVGIPISHELGNIYFNIRSCGIAIHDGRVLGVKIAPYDFWIFPGGRVEYMESSAKALIREIREELNASCQVVRLLWYVEDFYRFEGQDTHELCYYYLVEFPSDADILGRNEPWNVEEDAKKHEESKRLTFQWIPLASLDSVRFVPKHITTKLGDLPHQSEFLILNHIKEGND